MHLKAVFIIGLFLMGMIVPNQTAFGQENSTPQFKGGQIELKKFINRNYKYPTEAEAKDIEGLVEVGFVVSPDGTIDSLVILHDIGAGCGQELLRVVSLTKGKWASAKWEGQNISKNHSVKINFQLTDGTVAHVVQLANGYWPEVKKIGTRIYKRMFGN